MAHESASRPLPLRGGRADEGADAGTAQVTDQPDLETARQRDRFLSAFAHEIRSPLTVAQGWVSMLLDDDVPSGDIVDSVRHLDQALSRLADRTLDFEMLAASSLGRLRLRPYRLPIGDLVADLPGLDGVDGEGAGTEVYVDPDFFRPVLRDLWNAARLRPEPDTVRLRVTTCARGVEIRAVRAGDPMEPSVLRALFEPFETNDDATGVTLGLYLACALTVAHGGTVGVDQGDDGAEFWVRVPHQQPTTRSSR